MSCSELRIGLIITQLRSIMESLFHDKKVPYTLSRETRNLIELIGETKNKSTEEDIIKKEINIVKNQLAGNCDP